jgi:xylulokinase
MAATGQGASVATPPTIARTIAPDMTLHAAFSDAHARYRAAYRAVKDI